MKRETRILFQKALDSLVLSIEHFNRPWDLGREEVVLILLDRAFELILKAAITHNGGKIREPRAKETIGHDKCVRKCLTEAPVKCLNEDQALTIQIVNSLRDAAQHYILEISEQQLYLYAQAAVTLFAIILKSVFDQELLDFLPERVLPISSSPPRELDTLMAAEFAEVKQMIAPGSRKRLLARARVRPLAIVEASLRGERSQPSKGELDRILKQVSENKSWQDVFPGVASLRLDTSGTGLSVTLKIVKSKGEPITLVPEGTPGATVVAVKRVNELDYYSLGLQQLSDKLHITMPRAFALVKHTKLQSDPDMFREIRLGKARFKRYSPRAIDYLKAEMAKVDMDEVWRRNRPPSSRRR